MFSSMQSLATPTMELPDFMPASDSEDEVDSSDEKPEPIKSAHNRMNKTCDELPGKIERRTTRSKTCVGLPGMMDRLSNRSKVHSYDGLPLLLGTKELSEAHTCDELPGMADEPPKLGSRRSSEAALPTIDSLTDFLPAEKWQSQQPSLAALPEVPDHKGDKLRSIFHAKGYHIGKRVRVCNHMTGTKVDGVVIDSNGDQVKLFYMIGQRGFTQVACAAVMNMGLPANRNVEPGAIVQVRSSTVNAWFKGTVMWGDSGYVKVNFRHNGRLCTKTLSRHSPDLRILTRTKEPEAEELPKQELDL